MSLLESYPELAKARKLCDKILESGGDSIDSILGEGGFGVAFKTRQGKALKLTRSAVECTTVNFIRRLESLNPIKYLDNIVEYYSSAYLIQGDGSEGDNNTAFFYLMELVEAFPLDFQKSLPKYHPDAKVQRDYQKRLSTMSEEDKREASYGMNNCFINAFVSASNCDRYRKEKKPKQAAKEFSLYLDNLRKCSEVEGFEDVSNMILDMSVSTEDGGPFLIGDFKPLNCGIAKDGRVKAFDLWFFDIPDIKRYYPERYYL